MNAKQPNLQTIRRNLLVQDLMTRTGCTEKQARAELIAEEWNLYEAIRNIRQAQAQGAI